MLKWNIVHASLEQMFLARENTWIVLNNVMHN